MLISIWPTVKTGRPAYNLKQSLYITLWYLSNKCSFRELSDRFGCGRATVHRIFYKTIKTICKLKAKIIKFPSTVASQRKIMEDFANSRSHPFPFVLGCIDGSHIKISTPKTDSVSYYNRKGTHSVIIQVRKVKSQMNGI